MNGSILHRVRAQPFRAIALGLIVLAGCGASSPGDPARGGLPNLTAPTLGGTQLWADVAWSEGWRVQRNVWTRHHRLLDVTNMRRAWGSESYCVARLPEAASEAELVVLLHGLGRTRHSMRSLHETLEAEDYRVASLSYPSTRASIDEHAKSVERVLNDVQGVRRVSFVTHSLGGRLVRRLLEREGAWRARMELGRVVQIAPPNRGSALAASLQPVPFLACLLGPSFVEVVEAETCAPPTGCEFGVIAGVGPTSIGWNPWLPGDDDGVVTVAEAELEFPHSQLRVESLHTFLMNDERVLKATKRFLADGTFDMERSSEPPR